MRAQIPVDREWFLWSQLAKSFDVLKVRIGSGEATLGGLAFFVARFRGFAADDLDFAMMGALTV